MTCATCGTDNREGRKFCSECGTSLASGCPSCGAANEPGEKFCGECGATLISTATPPAAAPTAPAAERRLVSVLFADLVGFTTASEGRDSEETRELLSQYFEISQGIIERYGGTVEKFIGDAVMAVWGTPVATEDDSERAVRAALELVAAMPELHPALQARAGVLTGEAAVTLGATTQGMVAGDLVNTASRVQSAAEPGNVLVDEATRTAADAAVAFEDAGDHELKGKAEPVRLWRALRVVANRGGEGRSSGLEAPFVGRERELRIVKDLFHASAEDGRAHIVLVTGSAGLGKSRLSWEFEKYLDGLALTAWWHRGRCPSYGEGVAYWALAEMVRGRSGILENDEADAALATLSAAVERHVPLESDRDWVHARLAQLLGLADASFERDDLFAAWRLFFESLADEEPTILVFEDLQWADAGLLDFIEYLVEWARTKPIFVLGLARPELAEKRPTFGTTTRGGFTGLALEPLSDEAMDALLEGLVPGLPEGVRASIRSRAEGIPLYAVETVRMLMNRGQLEQADGSYRVVGELDTLAVPETLHALVASRIDGLESAERELVQNASVLGKTFVVEAIASMAGTSNDRVEPILGALVRKEILFLESDPRSAERGQYGFLQDLVRRVAYETLAKRDRKARHLAAASFFESSWAGREQEVVEVVASHYLTALELEPDAAEADQLRATVRETLARAGERAASLGANAEAATAFARAAGLAGAPREEARLLALAGKAAGTHADTDRATGYLLRAVELYEQEGDHRAAARASADLALIESLSGRIAEAIERMEHSHAVLMHDEPNEDLAFFLSQLARWLYFVEQFDLCAERNDRALEIGERLRLLEVLSHALNTKGLLASEQGLWETSRALTRHALELALESNVHTAMIRGYTNLGEAEARLGNFAEAEALRTKGLELCRRIGDRGGEWWSLGNLSETHIETGKWDEVMRLGDELPEGLEFQALGLHVAAAEIARHRGDPAAARKALERTSSFGDSAAFQQRVVNITAQYNVFLAEGDPAAALALAENARDVVDAGGFSGRTDLLIAESALMSGEIDRAARAVATVEALAPGESSTLTSAAAARFRAALSAAEGDAERAESSFKSAAATFREYGTPFRLACTQLEYAEWLVSQGREDDAAPLASEARATFEQLRATPWLERADALAARLPASSAVTA
jgi:class 3 adenylate cyclase/tetratricopeptide (TPR) repeat protein